jgi:TonB family protein
MFDKLIESDTVGAEFKSRRRYFLISSVVVGLLFISAVVISLYAADIGLGNDNYELAAIVAPIEPPPDAPEPPQPQHQQRQPNERTSDIPSRAVRQLPIDATPTSTPPISTIPNRYMSLPPGPVQSGPDGDPPTFGSVGGKPETGSGGEDKSPRQSTEMGIKTDSEPGPPPAEPKRSRYIGVANGYAISLPKPPYPTTAMAVNAQGKVDVQITIDEDGKVISAKAVNGNPLLRSVSEEAARKARFKPTTISNVPIKVTGVIIYNFTRD